MDFFGILFDMKNGKKVPYSKTYFDTLFAENLAGVTTLTGTLPLTFTTSETTLRSWTIYGNNTQHNYSAEGTLPLTFTSHTAGNASDWEIFGNDNIGKNKLEITEDTTTKYDVTFTVNLNDGSIVATGTCSSSSANQAQFNIQGASKQLISDGLISDGMIISCENLIAGTRFALVYYDTNETYISEQICDNTNNSQVISIPSNAIYYRFYVRKTATAGDTTVTFKPMLRLAGTSADFEPYQVGVGERTANLFNKNAPYTPSKYLNAAGDEVAGATWGISEYIQIEGNSTYTAYNLSGGGASACWYDGNKNFIGGKNYGGAETKSFSLPSNARYIRLTLRIVNPSNVDTFMLIEGTTPPVKYIPFGYQIPITVSQTGQTNKNYDIYIGDSPLTEGQTISNTQEIEVFEGTNTITTDLYNKPSMSIEGIDYVGVGEPVNNSWQIPLTVSDGTNTATVNVPIDAPLTEGQSVTDTLTINTFEGENTVDTTLENKPQMSITYKGG